MTAANVLGGIDWNSVLLYGVPAYIAAIGGAVSAIIGSRNRKSLKTSNGKTIAQAVESTHAAVTANTATLSDMNDHPEPPPAPAVPHG